ncbi:hypothetical protein ADIMK_2845 [Marinobacterium lacunae]|uniref:Uncharacterized protein n=1 Tax=Marinobacterium lacunae TaxID=1232683 RepID=A0A081FXR6_9GAMM|nr:hypothetical protein ADIMK_2845 [Marinobacterium lacunae]
MPPRRHARIEWELVISDVRRSVARRSAEESGVDNLAAGVQLREGKGACGESA